MYTKLAAMIKERCLPHTREGVATVVLHVTNQQMDPVKVSPARMLRIRNALMHLDAANHTSAALEALQMTPKGNTLDMMVKSLVENAVKNSEGRVILAVRQLLTIQQETIREQMLAMENRLYDAWGMKNVDAGDLPSAPALPIPAGIV